jgi:hypothetical protein
VLAEPAPYHAEAFERKRILLIESKCGLRGDSCFPMAIEPHEVPGQVHVILRLLPIETDGSGDDVGRLRQILMLGGDETQQEEGLGAVRLPGQSLHAQTMSAAEFFRGNGVSRGAVPGLG